MISHYYAQRSLASEEMTQSWNTALLTAEAMVDPDNYILAGDSILAVPRSIHGDPVEGRVILIEGVEPGRREFIVELKDTHWLNDGAMGLPENLYRFKVCRGDAWVLVPHRLLPEEAAAKAERSYHNTQKRILSEVPLFASHIAVVAPSMEDMLTRFNHNRQEELQRAHDWAVRANGLRCQVQSLVTEEQFAILCAKRSRHPREAGYGIEFWKRQLAHIEKTGQPYIFVPPIPVHERLNIAWLRPDAHIIWLSPDGKRTVRVLFIGRNEVLVKILGQAITDYDPRQYPYGNAWVFPDRLEPLS